MGTIYLARDEKFPGLRWAIKEMSDAGMSTSDRLGAARAFQQEADILSRLDHPHIPKVTNYFTRGNCHYLVMTYIQGQTLQQMLDSRRQPFPEEQVAEWGIQLCEILEYLHAQEPPVIFRDLKPANIMLDQQGQVKLIDFGIARLFNPAKKTDTVHLGTIGFAPPEQYEAQGGATDTRSDIYALGATLHYLLTLRNPSDEAPFTFDEALPRQLNPRVSAGMEQVVMKAVQKEAAARYQSAKGMKQALEGVKGVEAMLAALYQQAEAAIRRGNHNEAIRLWGQVWARNPNYLDVGQRIVQARAASAPQPPPPSPPLDVIDRPRTGQILGVNRRWLALAMVGLVIALLAVAGYYGSRASDTTPTLVATSGPEVVAQATTPRPTHTSAPTATHMTVPTRTPTRTRTPTLTPKPTRTPSPTATRRPTSTPTRRPDGLVAVDACNLRQGPGTEYDVVDVLKQGDEVRILAKNAAGDWAKVKVGGQVGWLAVDLLDLQVSLAGVLVAANIPPTPTPSTPTATPTPKVCPPDPALVEINNMLDSTETFVLDGPEHIRFAVAPGKTNLCFLAGTYSRSWVTNDNSKDSITLEPGSQIGCACWNLYSDLQLPPRFCLCSENAADYSRP
jgi:hypothetical protein